MKPNHPPDSPGDGSLVPARESLKSRARRWFQVHPSPEPARHPQFEKLAKWERGLERTRIFMLRFERWLSSGGVLRAFVRFCLLLALFTGIPAVMLGPPLLLLLQQATAVAAQLAAFAEVLAQASRSLLAATVGFILFYVIVRTFFGRR